MPTGDRPSLLAELCEQFAWRLKCQENGKWMPAVRGMRVPTLAGFLLANSSTDKVFKFRLRA